ncbi:ASCH domain-containing protein [Acidicapsa dinghuensis]|uniref:ASCH domain-containing protein n=1 Tax=Acidicapsa dinghuensis TaxID=2218256 RepID=A0ABW1ECT6_9BACT|nr:ASCH domain-containing protein [Acidicapsa dinghuensis]
MKALSVLPPWWWFILHGYKDIENRSWPTNYRGTVYLHVGKTFEYEEIVEDLWTIFNRMPGVKLPGADAIDSNNFVPFVMNLKCAAGCIVGKVDIVGCVRESPSPWFEGKFGFQLANPVAFALPVPWRGMPGLFDVPSSIELASGSAVKGVRGERQS